MQTTMPGSTVRDSAAFAMFTNDTLTIDFKKLAHVHDMMRNQTLQYAGEMQRAMNAARSAQGEVTRCNNEVSVLKEAIAQQKSRIAQLESSLEGLRPQCRIDAGRVKRKRWWNRG